MTSVIASEHSDWAGRGVAKAEGFGRLVGVWLGLIPFADLLLRPRSADLIENLSQARETPALLAAVLTVIVALGIFPVIWAALRFGVDFRRAKYLYLGTITVCLSIPISYFARQELDDILYVIIVYYVFSINIIMISVGADRVSVLRGIFTALAIMHGAAMIAVLVDNDSAWGRLLGRTAPNYWGAVAYTTLIALVAMRGWILKLGLVGLSLAVLYQTQSRGSLFAAAIALLLIAGLASRRYKAAPIFWLLGAGVAVIVGILASDLIANRVLLIADPARGFDSGVTGRAGAWRETWEIFQAHPWFGIGYRKHEQYLTSQLSAHNAYLAAMAETGTLGLLGYLIFLGGAVWRAALKAISKPDAPNLACVGFLVAYMFLGFVERAGLDTGNAYSLLMITLAAWAWRRDDPLDVSPAPYDGIVQNQPALGPHLNRQT